MLYTALEKVYHFSVSRARTGELFFNPRGPGEKVFSYIQAVGGQARVLNMAAGIPAASAYRSMRSGTAGQHHSKR
jgi:hypothetical protein